jgi:hypothetical protein
MIARSALVLLLVVTVSRTAGADLVSDSDFNTYGGTNAFASNVDGTRNTAVGVGTMYLAKHGTENTALGNGALASMVTGSRNTAVGSLAIGAAPSIAGAATGNDNTL